MKSVFYSLILSLSRFFSFLSLSLPFVFHSWNVTFLAQTCLHMFPLVTYVFWGKFPSSAKNSHVCSSHVPWGRQEGRPNVGKFVHRRRQAAVVMPTAM